MHYRIQVLSRRDGKAVIIEGHRGLTVDLESTDRTHHSVYVYGRKVVGGSRHRTPPEEE